MSKTLKTMIDPDEAVMLLIDHQSGLFQLVRDIDQSTLRTHVTALAKVARLARVPTFTTASVPDARPCSSSFSPAWATTRLPPSST